MSAVGQLANLTDPQAVTAALVIDGEVKLSGKAASEAELTAILTAALAEKEAGK